MQRMASEVNWYNFMLGDFVVFAPGDWLFGKPSGYTFKEFDKGIGYIDGDFDINKLNGSVTIHTRIEEWPVDPGVVVTLQEMGVWSGDWLVSAYERSLFSHEVTVTAVKPKPKFPEPKDTGNIWSPGHTGGEIPHPGKKSPVKGQHVRDKIAAWGLSGTKGPPPYYRSPSDPLIKKPGFWPKYLDCAGFVMQCYAWGSDFDEDIDPMKNSYGTGSTGTMYPNGRNIPQDQVQRADVLIMAPSSGAVGGPLEHTCVFIEDWKGPQTRVASHGGSNPGPSVVHFQDEVDWHITNHGTVPTIKNYID
jgi:hypothetical protein